MILILATRATLHEQSCQEVLVEILIGAEWSEADEEHGARISESICAESNLLYTIVNTIVLPYHTKIIQKHLIQAQSKLRSIIQIHITMYKIIIQIHDTMCTSKIQTHITMCTRLIQMYDSRLPGALMANQLVHDCPQTTSQCIKRKSILKGSPIFFILLIFILCLWNTKTLP